MKKAKIISILTIIFLLLNLCLSLGAAATESGTYTYTETIPAQSAVIDSNSSGGYDGEYFFVYNSFFCLYF